LYSKITAEAQRRSVVFYFLFLIRCFLFSALKTGCFVLFFLKKLSIPILNMNEFCIPKFTAEAQRRSVVFYFLFLIRCFLFSALKTGYFVLFFLKKLSIPILNMNEFCIPKFTAEAQRRSVFFISYSVFPIFCIKNWLLCFILSEKNFLFRSLT
jgi:hypothetical protein